MNIIPIFPALVDNSMRKDLVKCQKSAYYKHELGFRSNKQTRVDLHAGGSFAKGMEEMRRVFYVERKREDEALFAGIKKLYEFYGNFPTPTDSNKSADRMAGAMTYYVQQRPLGEEDLEPINLGGGKVGLEIGFSFATNVGHPDTGEAILYGGRMDMLGLSKKDGKVWIVDEKTGKSLGDKWANQWQMDSSLTGYYMGARKLLDDHGLKNLQIGGAYINGIAIKKYDYEHVRVAAYRSDWEIDRWWQQMNRDLARWVEAHRLNDYDYALDHACAYYNNPCEFEVLCKSRNPERVMDGNFRVERWNPLAEVESK